MKTIEKKLGINSIKNAIKSGIYAALLFSLIPTNNSCSTNYFDFNIKREDSLSCRTHHLPKGSEYETKDSDNLFERFTGFGFESKIIPQNNCLYNYYKDSIPENDKYQKSWFKITGYGKTPRVGSHAQWAWNPETELDFETGIQENTGYLLFAPYIGIAGEIRLPKEEEVFRVKPLDTTTIGIIIDQKKPTQYIFHISTKDSLGNLKADTFKIDKIENFSEVVKGYRYGLHTGSDQPSPQDITIKECDFKVFTNK
jgi:hypothetical protein